MIPPFVPIKPALDALPPGRLARLARRGDAKVSQFWDSQTNATLETTYHEMAYFKTNGNQPQPTVPQSWDLLSQSLRGRFLEGMTADHQKSVHTIMTTLRRQKQNVLMVEEAADVVAGSLTLTAMRQGVLTRVLIQDVVNEIHAYPQKAKDIGLFTEHVANKFLKRLPYSKTLQPFLAEARRVYPLHTLYPHHEDPEQAYREFVALLAIKFATQFPEQLKKGSLNDPLDTSQFRESLADEFQEFVQEVPGGLKGPFRGDLNVIKKALDPGTTPGAKINLQAFHTVCQTVARILNARCSLNPRSPLIGELIKLAAYKMELRRGLDIYFRDGKALQFVSSRRSGALLGDGIDLEDKTAFYGQIKGIAKKFEYARMAWVLSQLQRVYSAKYPLKP